MTPIADAAAAAPARIGVYLFIGPSRSVVYVGKASNLRRRLGDHARGGGRLARFYGRVEAVRWEEHPDDEAAAAREADLILALAPPANASFAADGRWAYVCVTTDAGRVRIAVTDASAYGRAYGCFPYLGPGVHSLPARACSDGYTAFLRLLWAAGDAAAGSQYPAAIRGTSPPARLDVALDDGLARPLHDFLAGTSDRLLRALDPRVARRDAYMQPALRRDRAAAEGFYRFGPRAIRELARRHGVRMPLSRERFVELIRSEIL